MTKQKSKKFNKLKIAIIGFGRFGSLLSEILHPFGEIFIVSRRRIKRKKVKQIDCPDLKLMDWIIPAVPISTLKDVFKKINPHIGSGALVMDVSSVKVYPCRWLRKYLRKDVETIGTHPMFGPDSAKKGLAGLQIVICPVRASMKRLKEVESVFKKLGLKVIRSTPENHDKQAAKSLALVHYLGRALVKMKIKKQAISTLGFERLLLVNETVSNDTWQLFFDMHRYNPYSQKARQDLMQSLRKLDYMIKKYDNGENELLFLRRQISEIDKAIINLLTQRFRIVKEVGKVKQKNNLPIKDKEREAEIIKKMVKQSSLNKRFINDLYKLIFNQAYLLEERRNKK